MKKIVAAGLLASLMGVASAQVYVGVAGAQSHYDVDCGGAQDCQKNGVGYKMFGGYRINPEIALEGAYVNFGKAEGVVPESGYLVGIEGRSKGLLLDGVYRLALGARISLVGRAGVAVLRNRIKGSIDSVSVAETKTSLRPHIGIGAELALTQNVRFAAAADFTQAEYEFRGVSDSTDLRMLSLGIQYSF